MSVIHSLSDTVGLYSVQPVIVLEFKGCSHWQIYIYTALEMKYSLAMKTLVTLQPVTSNKL